MYVYIYIYLYIMRKHSESVSNHEYLLFPAVLDTIKTGLSPSAPYLLLILLVLLLMIASLIAGIIVTKYKHAKVRDIAR